MKLRKGMKIKFIKDLSKDDQDLVDMRKYIGIEFKILDHYQNKNSGLDEGEIQVNIPEEGMVILNQGEWEVVV